MFECCSKAVSIYCSSLDEHALMDGVSDIIVVKHKSNTFKSTQFFACFGPYAAQFIGHPVNVSINSLPLSHVPFTIDKYGYLYPSTLSSHELQLLHLSFGKNIIDYRI